jgi:hypothetical protein
MRQQEVQQSPKTKLRVLTKNIWSLTQAELTA